MLSLKKIKAQTICNEQEKSGFILTQGILDGFMIESYTERGSP